MLKAEARLFPEFALRHILCLSYRPLLELNRAWKNAGPSASQSRVRNGQTVAQNLTDGAVSMASASAILMPNLPLKIF